MGVKEWVPGGRMALQYYNHKEHAGTGHAPVEIHLGIDPRHPGPLAPPGQEAAPLDYAKLDDYNKEMAEIAKWVRGKLILRQAEQAREVARYYQSKNLKLQPGSLVWLNKRATNQVDGDMIVARKLALQWSGPFLYVRTVNDALGEICRQRDGEPAGKTFQVHLSKLRLYREPAAYPGQHADLFKPGNMGALGDGSTEADEEEADALLQLPAVELRPEDAAREQGDHLYRFPPSEREIPDEIDQPPPQVPASVKVREWLGDLAPSTKQARKAEKKRQKERNRREPPSEAQHAREAGGQPERRDIPDRVKPAQPRWQPVQDEMMSAESVPPAPQGPRDNDWQLVRRRNRKKDLSPIPPSPPPCRPDLADKMWHASRDRYVPITETAKTLRATREFNQTPSMAQYRDKRVGRNEDQHQAARAKVHERHRRASEGDTGSRPAPPPPTSAMDHRGGPGQETRATRDHVPAQQRPGGKAPSTARDAMKSMRGKPGYAQKAMKSIRRSLASGTKKAQSVISKQN